MAPPGPSGVFDILRGPLAATPDAPALVTRSARLTYAELDAAADRAAAALADLGVRPGDRVAASLPNDAPIVVAFHGAMRLGAIWVGINQALAPPEKTYMLNDCGAVVLLADDPVADALEAAGATHPARVVRPDEWTAACAASTGRPAGPPADRPTGPATGRPTDRPTGPPTGPRTGRPTDPDPGAPAAIAYTSGTTGFPKGAVHCQAGLILPGAATVLRRNWGPELRKGDSLPLTILNMLTLTTLLAAQAGATAVIIDRADVASIVEWIRTERITVWNGPPAQLWTMVRDESIDPADLASLDEVWVGGADCPDRLRMDFEARFGIRVCRTYGLTEAPALVALDDLDYLNDLDDLDDLDDLGDPGDLGGGAPEGTSGRPLDHVAVDTSDGEIVLRPNPDGPLAGRYRPALGYWEKPDAATGVIDGQVLRTGDLGVLEPSGHLRVLGRKSTVINRGGANVYPAEVERVLVDAPGVAACSVVGVPDERLGERVGAALEGRAGQSIDLEKVAEHCRANLAAYKVPERWAVVEKLPRNQMGKVPAPAVRELIQSAPSPARA